MTETSVTNDEREKRFLVTVDGTTAELVYRVHGDRLVLVHTGVPDELEGQGVGSALVAAAIDFAQEQGFIVEPRCPFARGWLERHPDDAQRVTIDWSTPESTR
jgi:predicted GNAT family acetyltransferase